MPDTTSDPAAELARLTDLATPYAVRAAVTLGLPEILEAGPASAAELAKATGADQDSLDRLLRYLVAHHVFAAAAPDRYALNDISRQLTGPDGAPQRAWLNLSGAGARMDAGYAGLADAVRKGSEGYSSVHGLPLWADLAERPDLRSGFDELMGADTARIAHLLATEYDWTGLGQLIDVGGGIGILLGEILDAQTHLTGAVFDLPPAAAAARRRFAAAGLGARAAAVDGSFFDRIPPGADAYLISRVLTDWNDEAAQRILANCVTAARPGGRVLIVEMLPDDVIADPRSAYDLQMLVVVGGKLRSTADFTRLAERAGAVVVGVRRWACGLTVLDCRPS
ncbi:MULTISPECIES: methyltransferase [unclassified Nocardia]|uniref:methyltransferase n=1 Tax=unclassified Nocardia TaxID=2637762 RepID=UPI001CE4AE06|nr:MULTISPECIES: methyltransferase [unclassified Nocardia]